MLFLEGYQAFSEANPVKIFWANLLTIFISKAIL
jgi:hypothetical protein